MGVVADSTLLASMLSDFGDILSCPVCLEIPREDAAVYHCAFGHLLCTNCFLNLLGGGGENKDVSGQIVCPICRGPLKNRSSTAEQMIKAWRQFQKKQDFREDLREAVQGAVGGAPLANAGKGNTPKPRPRTSLLPAPKPRQIKAKPVPRPRSAPAALLPVAAARYSLVSASSSRDNDDTNPSVQRAIEASIKDELDPQLLRAIKLSKLATQARDKLEREALDKVLALSINER